MKNFYEDFGSILGFMIMTLIIEISFGEKVERYWLLLILFGMVILNYNKFTNFLTKYFTL